MNNDNKCNEWNLNKNVNPITKRKIKIDGSIYKKLELLCKNINKDNKCNEWKLNKNVNPITKRKIKIGGPIYKYYENLCFENDTIVSLIKSSINKKSSYNSSLSSSNSSSSSSSLIDSSLSYSVISSNNKTVKDEIIDIIKVKRKKNLLIINKFLNEKFNLKNDNNCLTIKDNRIYINNILRLKKIIGIGSYGIAYLMDYDNKYDNDIINYVIKLTVLKKYENIHEIRILELLTKYAIDYEFPHFPITYDILSCNRSNINKLLEDDIDDIEYFISKLLDRNNGDILFIINEYANGGDLRTFNKKINANTTYENIETIKNNFCNALAQILIGMMFYHKIVNSSHGDLHQHNVLNHITIPGGYFHYKLYGKDYYIENIGHIWVIWDFGFAVPFDNINIINKNREQQLKTHIFNYLKNKNEPSDLTNYFGNKFMTNDKTYLYNKDKNKHIIKRDNILYDLKFFCDLNYDYCIYRYYVETPNKNYKFIKDLVDTINTDVVYKCIDLDLTSDELPTMQKLIIDWMVKMNLLLTEIPPNSKIINKDNPYVL